MFRCIGGHNRLLMSGGICLCGGLQYLSLVVYILDNLCMHSLLWGRGNGRYQLVLIMVLWYHMLQLYRVRRIVIFGHCLRCQALYVEALCRLQQRWQLCMVDTHLAAVDKLQQCLQIVGIHARQHNHGMLAWRILKEGREEE